MAGLLDKLARGAATAVFRLVRGRVRARPGVHAIALTPDRRIILVKLRYAPGWRLPGGGRDEHEEAEHSALRELREEIGMTSHGAVRRASPRSDELLIVDDVRYRPKRWSWEVEKILEAPLDDLPHNLSPRTRRWLASVQGTN
jgi:8-oxo-dGTP pyrophosphatase MutT (NUDIX family)